MHAYLRRSGVQLSKVLMVWLMGFSVGSLAADGNAQGELDSDEDGVADADEVRRGTDPKDYYDGVLPELTFLGGEGQSGEAGAVMKWPVTVQVGQAFVDAPVKFSSEKVWLSADGVSDWSHELTVRSATEYGVTAARVYLKLDESAGWGERVVISAASKGQTTSIETAAGAHSKSLRPPTGLKVSVLSATALYLEWVPTRMDLPTSVEMSEDGGLTWELWGVMEPGVTDVAVEGLKTGKRVDFRLRTGDASSKEEKKADAKPAVK